jgi:hypothetical protein
LVLVFPLSLFVQSVGHDFPHDCCEHMPKLESPFVVCLNCKKIS